MTVEHGPRDDGTLPVLDGAEQRLLGALMEKQVTVPATYPLTANALRAACNQSSSREPVTDYDERTVETTARALRDRGLLRIVWADTGRRTLKYHQTLEEVLGLSAQEKALLTVMLLRGPQSAGELRGRTERLHPFGSKDDVEEHLQAMAARTPALVVRLDRRPGQQDHRWAHLLGPVPTQATPAPAEAVDREVPLAGGADARDERVRTTYAAIAADYADTLTAELEQLAFECWLLDRVAAHAVADGRPVVDAGCGPGHVAAYLAAAGADARGVDLTPAMVEQARARYPEVSYEVGDLRRLLRPPDADGWSAVLAWYSLIHLAGSELPAAVEALARPLAPGGLLVLALHGGGDVRHVSTWFGHDVEVDILLHEPDDVAGALTAAGLVDVEWYLRGPMPVRNEATRRLYLLARKA